MRATTVDAANTYSLQWYIDAEQHGMPSRTHDSSPIRYADWRPDVFDAAIYQIRNLDITFPLLSTIFFVPIPAVYIVAPIALSIDIAEKIALSLQSAIDRRRVARYVQSLPELRPDEVVCKIRLSLNGIEFGNDIGILSKSDGFVHFIGRLLDLHFTNGLFKFSQEDQSISPANRPGYVASFSDVDEGRFRQRRSSKNTIIRSVLSLAAKPISDKDLIVVYPPIRPEGHQDLVSRRWAIFKLSSSVALGLVAGWCLINWAVTKDPLTNFVVATYALLRCIYVASYYYRYLRFSNHARRQSGMCS